MAKKDLDLRRKIISSLKDGEMQESKIQGNTGIKWPTLRSILEEELCGAKKETEKTNNKETKNTIEIVKSPDGILIKEIREKNNFWKPLILEDNIGTKLNRDQICGCIRKTIEFFREDSSIEEYQKLMNSKFGGRVIEYLFNELSAIANQDIVWDLALEKVESWNANVEYLRDYSARCPNCGKSGEFEEEEAEGQFKVCKRCRSCGQRIYTDGSWNDPFHPDENKLKEVMAKNVKKVLAKKLQEFKDNYYPAVVFLDTIKRSPDCLLFILDILEGRLEENNLQFYFGRGNDLTDNIPILLGFEELFILKPRMETTESPTEGEDKKGVYFLHVSLYEVFENLIEGLNDIKNSGLLEQLAKCFITDSMHEQTNTDVEPLGESTVILKPESSSEEVKTIFEKIKPLLRKGDSESVSELLNSIKIRAEVSNNGRLSPPVGPLDHFINYTTIYSAILGFALRDENIDKYFLHELKAHWKRLVGLFNYFDNYSEDISIRPANPDEVKEIESPPLEDIVEEKLNLYKDEFEGGEDET